MSRAKLVVVAAMAIVAISALASASASALPEFLPTTTKAKFTSTSGPGTLETSAKEQINCSADTNEGQILSATTFDVTIKFTGCKAFGIANCSTTGAASGELVVKATATLGYLSKTAKTVGAKLNVTEFEFTCAGGLVKGKVKGAVIGQLTPVNKKTKTGELILKQTGGENEFQHFEGEATLSKLESSKNGGAFELAGEETTDTITFAEEITLDA